jgi:PAS domain S-box-containing protein
MSATERYRAVTAPMPNSPQPGHSPAEVHLPLERLPLAYVAVDSQDHIVEWNPAAEVIFGYSREEALGKSAIDLLLPFPHENRVDEILKRVHAGDMHAHSVNDNRTKDGRIITCAWFNTPLLHPDGAYAGGIGLVQDVTVQRQLDDRRREIEERFLQLAENIDGYFWLNSPDGSEMYYMSPGYEKIIGRSCASLYERPQSWIEVIHPEDRGRVLSTVLEPMNTECRQTEYRIVRPDGAVRWIRDRAFPVRDSDGNICRIAGIGEDITERKEAKQALENYANRLQALSHRLVEVQEQERHRLSRELHDEIGQLLTSVRFALEEGTDGLATTAKCKLNEARTLIEEALARVRELAYDLRPALLDHFGLLSGLRFLMERFTGATGITVNFCCAELPARFTADVEIAAYRIVQEALTNVARHARTNEAAVRIWTGDAVLNVQVEDEGVGFDPQKLAGEGGSTGLAGMEERVRLLGGRLAIESAPGSGTHVLAELPIRALSGNKIDEYLHSLGR